jgi:hypothetical protein
MKSYLWPADIKQESTKKGEILDPIKTSVSGTSRSCSSDRDGANGGRESP